MYLGVDLGSRTIKVASVRDGRLHDWQVAESGFDPHSQSLQLLARYESPRIAATGYGRHLAQKRFAEEVITEIKAHALGARYFAPECRTIIDVGGQDSKVISLDEGGRIVQFHMNDKCAAGTGRFMEIMAAILGYTLTEFAAAAAASTRSVPINSMCAVFAESEVVGLRNRGIAVADIARAIHLAVADRLVIMLERIGVRGELVFSGGVARNRFLVQLLGERLACRPCVPEAPEIVGALGAALHMAGKG